MINYINRPIVTHIGRDQAQIVMAFDQPQPAQDATTAAYTQMAQCLKELDMTVFHERIFASLKNHREIVRERERVLEQFDRTADTPFSFVNGRPLWGDGLAGVIVHAVRADSGEIWTIDDGDRPVGRGWTCDGQTHLMLQSITGEQRSDDNADQIVTHLLERAQQILNRYGATYCDVARTWFYIDDILDWYAEFNTARNAKYEAFGIMPKSGLGPSALPASTGIGAKNPHGAKLVADIMAVVPTQRDRELKISRLLNGAQKEAYLYGSAFSRAVTIEEDDKTLIQLSGTAAIDEQSASLYPHDVLAQVDCTFGKIETLLDPVGASLLDVSAAVAFVKRKSDGPLVRQKLALALGRNAPVVCVIADVCRDELLFELDAELVVHRAKAASEQLGHCRGTR